MKKAASQNGYIKNNKYTKNIYFFRSYIYVKTDEKVRILIRIKAWIEIRYYLLYTFNNSKIREETFYTSEIIR